MSWNRKYRPRNITDLHLRAVREYFTTLLTSTAFPQVFLFTGPKGTGKTSTARIVGALLNDPKNLDAVTARFFKKSSKPPALQEADSTNTDLETIYSGNSYLVQEMDAASNRGIDDVRALKERIQLPPVQGLMAVYILDEVHMLTTEAFNALLKLLEEPPSHVIFILATTEVQKVPETVLSRCQVVRFSLASEAELTDSLSVVNKSEQLKLPADMLQFIAQQATGSFRDAIKLLEQAAQLKVKSVTELQERLGLGYHESITAITSAVLNKNSHELASLFGSLRAQGAQEGSFHKDLVTYLHTQLMIGLGVAEGSATVPPDAARFLLQELSGTELSQPSPLPFLRLELKLLEIIERAKKNVKAATSASGPTAKTKTVSASTPAPKPTASLRSAALDQDQEEEEEEVATEAPHASSTFTNHENTVGNGQLLFQQWPSFVSHVAQTNFSLATLLKSAQPISGDTGQLTLSVFYKFHQEQLLQPKFTQQLNDLIRDTYGGSVTIKCILTEHPPQAELTEPASATNLEKLAADALM